MKISETTETEAIKQLETAEGRERFEIRRAFAQKMMMRMKESKAAVEAVPLPGERQYPKIMYLSSLQKGIYLLSRMSQTIDRLDKSYHHKGMHLVTGERWRGFQSEMESTQRAFESLAIANQTEFSWTMSWTPTLPRIFIIS